MDAALKADHAEATHAIAEYIAELRFSDLPDLVVAHAKCGILDTIGVALAGAGHPVGQKIVAYVESAGAAGHSRVLGTQLSINPEHAALANGVLAHALDFDDRAHASAHVLPTALAAAEWLDCSGQDLVLAYIAGRELRIQLEEEIDRDRFDGHRRRGPGSRGWHSTGTLGSIGSTATAAKLLKLQPNEICSAFGIAASLASGLQANWGTMTKPLHAGNAARNGIIAATLARSGFSGEPTIMSAKWGLVDVFCLPGECDIDRVPRALRAGFHIAEHGIGAKRYPCCLGSHPHIETMRLLRETHELRPDAVERIEFVNHEALIRLDPQNDLESKFSAAFALVATLVDGKVSLENCTDDFLFRDDIQSLLGRTVLVEGYAAAPFVRVTMKDGTVHQMNLRPWDRMADYPSIKAKYFDCTAPLVNDRVARLIEEFVANIEHAEKVRDLPRLMNLTTERTRA